MKDFTIRMIIKVHFNDELIFDEEIYLTNLPLHASPNIFDVGRKGEPKTRYHLISSDVWSRPTNEEEGNIPFKLLYAIFIEKKK